MQQATAQSMSQDYQETAKSAQKLELLFDFPSFQARLSVCSADSQMSGSARWTFVRGSRYLGKYQIHWEHQV